MTLNPISYKRFFIVLFTIFICHSIRAQEQPDTLHFRLNDYGIAANSERDAQVALNALIQAVEKERMVSESRPIKISMDKGVYHFYPDRMPEKTLYISNHDHVDKRKVAFFLSQLQSLCIDGEGSMFLFHGRVIPIVIDRCRELELRRFSIDNPHPALTQLQVLSKDKKGDLRVKVLDETKFRIEDGNKFIVEGEGYENRVSAVMPFSSDARMIAGRADLPFNPSEMIRDTKDPQRLTIKGWKENEVAKVGNRYVLRSWYRPCPGIVISDSQKIRINHLNIHYAEGMGLIAQHSEDIELNALSVLRNRDKGRYFTLQADATHFSGCRGQIRSVNGFYEQMADDAINVHGTYLRIDSIRDSKTLYASFAHSQSFGYTWSKPGDSLAIIDRKTLAVLFRTRLVKDEYVSKNDRKKKCITLAEPIPDELRDKDNLALENLSDYPTVTFEKNTIKNNRARGALFSTRQPVLCAYNLFDHTHGSAILLCGDANGWYESGPCGLVEIRNNRFVNALTAMYQFTNAIISVDPQIESLDKAPYYHGRIIVRDNQFETFPTPLIDATSVRRLEWQDNEIKWNQDYPSLFQDNQSKIKAVGTFCGDL